jgi:hypothetical protein
MTRPRTILAVALAAGTFGGTVGALATAAAQSQASPEAIAAAVQRVSDLKAENTLRTISSSLRSEQTTLAIVERYLGQVCEDTAPGPNFDLACQPGG